MSFLFHAPFPFGAFLMSQSFGGLALGKFAKRQEFGIEVGVF